MANFTSFDKTMMQYIAKNYIPQMNETLALIYFHYNFPQSQVDRVINELRKIKKQFFELEALIQMDEGWFCPIKPLCENARHEAFYELFLSTYPFGQGDYLTPHYIPPQHYKARDFPKNPNPNVMVPSVPHQQPTNLGFPQNPNQARFEMPGPQPSHPSYYPPPIDYGYNPHHKRGGRYGTGNVPGNKQGRAGGRGRGNPRKNERDNHQMGSSVEPQIQKDHGSKQRKVKRTYPEMEKGKGNPGSGEEDLPKRPNVSGKQEKKSSKTLDFSRPDTPESQPEEGEEREVAGKVSIPKEASHQTPEQSDLTVDSIPGSSSVTKVISTQAQLEEWCHEEIIDYLESDKRENIAQEKGIPMRAFEYITQVEIRNYGKIGSDRQLVDRLHIQYLRMNLRHQPTNMDDSDSPIHKVESLPRVDDRISWGKYIQGNVLVRRLALQCGLLLVEPLPAMVNQPYLAFAVLDISREDVPPTLLHLHDAIDVKRDDAFQSMFSEKGREERKIANHLLFNPLAILDERDMNDLNRYIATGGDCDAESWHKVAFDRLMFLTGRRGTPALRMVIHEIEAREITRQGMGGRITSLLETWDHRDVMLQEGFDIRRWDITPLDRPFRLRENTQRGLSGSKAVKSEVLFGNQPFDRRTIESSERQLGMSLHTLLYEFDVHRAIYSVTAFNLDVNQPEHVRDEAHNRLLRRNVSTRLIAACLGTASERAGICMFPNVNLNNYPMSHGEVTVQSHLDCGRFRLMKELGVVRKTTKENRDRECPKSLPLSIMNAFNLFSQRYLKFADEWYTMLDHLVRPRTARRSRYEDDDDGASSPSLPDVDLEDITKFPGGEDRRQPSHKPSNSAEDLAEIDKIRHAQFAKYSRAFSARRNRVFDYSSWSPEQRNYQMIMYESEGGEYIDPYPAPLILKEPQDEEEEDDEDKDGKDEDDEDKDGKDDEEKGEVKAKMGDDEEVDYEED